MSTQEMAAVQMQLQASAEQLQAVSSALDLLRQESGRAIVELHRLFSEARQSTTNGDCRINFVNSKSFEGGKFGGKLAEYKAWSKRVKIYCNSQCRGFKAALEQIEAQDDPMRVAEIQFPSGTDAEELDEKLFDFLVTYTTEEALGNVERFQGRGFEAWRQLKARYAPAGGRVDLDRSLRMLQRKARKHISELPAAIDQLERDLAHHDATASYTRPEQYKIILLVQLFPEAQAQYLKITFVAGHTKFQKVRDAVLSFSIN